MNKIENDNLTQLVIDAQNGVAGAFEKLYKETIKFSYGTASLLLTNKEDIEDVLQNSYMYVSKYLKDLRNPESFTNWLKVIVKHECQKYISQNHKKTEIFSAVLNSKNFDLVEDEEIPLDLIEQREINQIVKEIVDKMPEDKRACIVLYYFERNTLPEIAEILGIPEGTVKSRLYKARKLLEKEFGKHRKKDERLLGISVIPLVTAFFASQFKNAVVPAALAEGTALAATQAASAAAATATATATSAGMVAGSASASTASVGATTAGAVATGAVVSETLGTTIAAKVVAVAVAAAVTTGGGVATVNYVNEKKNVEPASTSTTAVTEEYATVAVIYGETTFSQIETAAASETLNVNSSRQTESGVTKPKESTSAHTEKRTTARQSSTAATTKTTTTKPTTTRAHTTQTTAVKTTTTAVLTTNAADVFGASNGIIGEYTGSDSSVDVPSSVGGEQITAIGTGAFAGNSSIESVNIPSTVNRIGQSAFEDCEYLSYVSLPSSLESIGIGAFCNCTSLRNVSIPSGTETIGDDAFADCSRLASITIPSSVTSIGDNAFGGCDNLTIKCSEGSAAHSYAVENSIDYELI